MLSCLILWDVTKVWLSETYNGFRRWFFSSHSKIDFDCLLYSFAFVLEENFFVIFIDSNSTVDHKSSQNPTFSCSVVLLYLPESVLIQLWSTGCSHRGFWAPVRHIESWSQVLTKRHFWLSGSLSESFYSVI